MNSRTAVLSALVIAALLCPAGCEEKPSPAPAPSQGARTPTPAPIGGAPADGHDTAAGHGGPVVELGNATIGPFSVRASRDQGEIKAGGDAPIDVWVTGGGDATVTGVRFWIGTQDAAGSVKAKADIENPAEPNRWHTHAEVPEPMPSGSMLWVEIEDSKGGRNTGSFDLKM